MVTHCDKNLFWSTIPKIHPWSTS